MLYIHFCILYITIKMYMISWKSLNNKVQRKASEPWEHNSNTKQTSPNIPNNFTRKTKDKPNHTATAHIKQPNKQNLKMSKSTTHDKIKTDKYNNTSPITWMTTFNSTHRPKKTAQMPTSPTNLMNYEGTTTSSSNNKLTKYETNQATKPKTEYLKSGTIGRYITT